MGKHIFKGFVRSQDEIWSPNSVIMGHHLRRNSNDTLTKPTKGKEDRGEPRHKDKPKDR